ncbi:MAG: DsrE family protein [Firmicutes bacterium]|nr:DsrE family protein [Alicyclobacillaceae bacterium]MCL6496083.1 DsrE family protein [Bacillota bacterium]
MAKIAFWITAGPELAEKVLPNLVMAERLKKQRGQEVEVYFFGPGIRLAAEAEGRMKEAIEALRSADIPMRACPAIADQYGVSARMTEQGIVLEPAGQVLVQLVESGYQVVGV